MFVTHSVEFNQDTLDTSIENYLSINYHSNKTDDLCYYIIVKHLIRYLKNHPGSQICNNLLIASILIKLKDMCYIHGRNENPEEVRIFTAAKKLELNLQDNINSSGNHSLFMVWCYIDTVLEQLEIKCARGDYGY